MSDVLPPPPEDASFVRADLSADRVRCGNVRFCEVFDPLLPSPTAAASS